MPRLRALTFVVGSMLLTSVQASAQQPAAPSSGRLTATFQTAGAGTAIDVPVPAIAARARLFATRVDLPQGSPRQLAIEYSDAYRRRAKIHRYASFATLPMFGAEAWVGQSLYNNPTDAKKSLHLAIATGMGALLAVNTFTGVLNLMEAKKDPHGRGRRLLHGILLLAADAGFLGAALTAPEGEHHRGTTPTPNSSRALHRTLAMSSIGLTTAGYLIMIFR
jgi:hypothetical protein